MGGGGVKLKLTKLGFCQYGMVNIINNVGTKTIIVIHHIHKMIYRRHCLSC